MRLKSGLFTVLIVIFSFGVIAQNRSFSGLEMNMGNLHRLSNAETRSISPENFTGEKGKGGMAIPDANAPRNTANATVPSRDLGQGWKVNPYVTIEPGETFTMAEIDGPGAIQHIWMTPTGNWRFSIIRIYWDDETEPSVEAPIGHFFGMGWNEYSPLNSLPVTVNPGSAFNSYWVMPFKKKAKITMTNINDAEPMNLYFQVDYTLTEVPNDAAYFHAQYRRTKVNETSDYTIVDGIKGEGHYVGVYMAWQVNNNGWWGEGEIKFFMDGDKQFPTIIGTGTEDYFLGSYNFDRNGKYVTFTTPYAGLVQVLPPDQTYKAGQRFGMYRWHVMDPIRFKKDLRVTIQDLGWRHGHRYLQQQSDISSVVFWYQSEPHAEFPTFPSWKDLEMN
jgi:hypothetical protein